MIGKNWQYNGLDMSDSQANINGFIIDNVEKNIVLRTEVFDNPNTHGAKTTNTLAGARIFSFTGKCFGETKQERYNAWIKLNRKIKPEGFFDNVRTGFYDLEWEDDNGEGRTCKAKVFQTPNPVSGLCDPIIEFTFALISEDATYTSGETLSANIPYNTVTEIETGGEFFSKPRFIIDGTIEDPRITITDLSLSYQLEKQITAGNELILDFSDYTITYNGDDVKKDRKAGSSSLFLNSDSTFIEVDGESSSGTPSIKVFWSPTYIHN